VIAAINDEGEPAPCTLSLDWIKKRVSFVFFAKSPANDR
jgi:hypothetical protein